MLCFSGGQKVRGRELNSPVPALVPLSSAEQQEGLLCLWESGCSMPADK